MPGPLVPVQPSAPPKLPRSPPDGGDFVLRLERDHAVVLQRQVVQDVAGGRDRVGAVDQFFIRQFGGGDHADRDGFVAGDLAILARGELGLGNLVLLVE